MDNSNNPNSSNPLNPAPPPSDAGTSYQPTWTPPPYSSTPTPTPPPAPAPIPLEQATPPQSSPVDSTVSPVGSGLNPSQPPSTPDMTSFSSPPNPVPSTEISSSVNPPVQSFDATASPFSSPTPTPLPTGEEPGPNSSPSPLLDPSPLDNPWGAPIQPPPLEQTSQPTWVPDPTPIQPEPTPPPEQSSSGPAPTDLSHLISNNPQENNGLNPSSASPETLVVPPTAGSATEVPTITAEGPRGIPKWLIGVGAGLLIIVAGASAYFILGIGQPPKTATSIPAEVSKTTVKTPPPIVTPIPLEQDTPATATGSANFGELQGNQQATSAADILRQRQQGR